MAKFIMLILAIVVLAAIIKEGSTLKCWRCSSDLSTGAFCADPFDPTLIEDEKQLKWVYIECNIPSGPYTLFEYQQAVCKKAKYIVNDQTIVSRSCEFQDVTTPPNQCSTNYTAEYRYDFCETCSTDGCNSA